MASAEQNVRRTGISVIVPTTDQPLVVKKLTWSAQLPHSRVVLANSEPCEGWTKQYNHLLGQGEPFRGFLGLPQGGSYRLVVTAPIDQGKSWMVPVAAAHCGLAQGEAIAAKVAESRLLIWGTGSLDLSVADTAAEARITQQEYHLTTKIDRSRHLFAEAAHAATPVLALVPHGEEAERAAGILAKVLGGQPHHIAIVASLAEVTAPIEHYLRSGEFVPPPPPPPSTALEPFVPPAPKAEPAAATTAEPSPAVGEVAADAEPQPAPAFEAATARRSVLGESRAAPSSLSLPIIAGAVVLLAGAAVAGYVMTRGGSAPSEPAQQPPSASAPAPAARPAQQASASQTAAPAQPGPQPAPAPTNTAASQQPAPTQPVPGQPAPGQPVPAQPAAVAGPALAKLTTLSAPPGSSCEAQVYDIRPRFVETPLEVPAGATSIEVAAPDICGVALELLGTTRARFQAGTGSAAVPSQSNPRRVIFNPTGTRGGQVLLPTIQIEGPEPATIEVKRR